MIHDARYRTMIHDTGQESPWFTSCILNLISCIVYLTPYGSICLAFSRLSLVSSTAPERRLLRVAFLPDNRWPFHPLRLMTLPVPVIFILLAVLFLVFSFIFTLAFAIFPPPKYQVSVTSCMVTTEKRSSVVSLIVHYAGLLLC